MRPIPPVAGTIHERAGMRPFYSGFGHVNTGYGGGVSRIGERGFGFRYGAGGYGMGYGHVATGFRGAGFGGYGRERFGAGRRYAAFRYARGLGGYGGYGRRFGFVGGGTYGGGTYGGGGYYGGGLYDGAGLGAYGGSGLAGGYGTSGTYGTPGTYGSYGTQAGYGGPYISEPPLAATRTESPLAPSPYGPDGGYYAPASDGVAPHILTVDRSSRAGCGCGPAAGAYPVIYRYGVGTAY